MRGFTLVELAIVLVIIGLIIGGILVGQSMFTTAKVNKLIAETQQYEILINQYKDRFKALPGDDPNALTVFGSACAPITAGQTNTCQGNGDGQVSTTYEWTRVWEHISLAGLVPRSYVRTNHYQCMPMRCSPASVLSEVKSNSTADDNPTIIYDFRYQTTPDPGTYAGNSVANPGNYLYLTRGGYLARYYPGAIPSELAAGVDAKIDDRLAGSGNVQGQNPIWTPGLATGARPCRDFNGALAAKYSFEKGTGCNLSIKVNEI